MTMTSIAFKGTKACLVNGYDVWENHLFANSINIRFEDIIK